MYTWGGLGLSEAPSAGITEGTGDGTVGNLPGGDHDGQSAASIEDGDGPEVDGLSAAGVRNFLPLFFGGTLYPQVRFAR